MTLAKAMVLRLFASGPRPRTTLVYRLLAAGATMVLLALLAHRLVPLGYLQGAGFGLGRLIALVCVTAMLGVSLIFTVLHAAQQGIMTRLTILQYMPLSRVQQWRLYLLAFIPLSTALVIGMSVVLGRFFNGLLPAVVLVVAIMGSLALQIACQVTVRLAGGWWSVRPQRFSWLMLVGAAPLCWAIVGSRSWWPIAITWAISTLQVAMVVYIVHRPVSVLQTVRIANGKVFQRLNLQQALLVRALRTSRYRVANQMILLVCGGLGLATWRAPHSVPFDAVAVAAVLLAGTLAQEARSLSNRLYPVELVLYGRVGQWLRASWVLTIGNWLVIVSAVLLFHQQLSVSPGYVVCLGLCLLAIGVASSSAVVPQKQDLLAQLATMLLYGAGAWAMFRLCGSLQQSSMRLAVATGLVVILGFSFSYLIEKIRWINTIRGTHGFVFWR